MISLPALLETKTPNEILKKLPQVRNSSIERLNFMLTSGIKMNELIETLNDVLILDESYNL